MVNAARFVGTSVANMRCGIAYRTARVYRVGEEEYVYEYDGVERPMEESSFEQSLNGLVVAIDRRNGERIPFPSFLSVAKYLGLLVGHILEEEKREREGERARRFLTIGTYTLEFNGKERAINGGSGIVCHWKGIYDGCWRGVNDIMVFPWKYDKKG